ncbi:hypothetical protein DSCO28_56740 [Desulfosarcina ovata subsp. sediminis]|uniref:Uncharacterized protein n=1 Tax=Desulfosarcina ovata subsp. sediminis TaxID=885957 RepID=A0A5K7ZXZ3_9BACT|nr:hypothetical protein DSCO28_56740 [Desulfosarcina ovata subsp. sediminis]
MPEINNSPRSRRIWGRLQGAGTRAYQGICAGGGNAVDGRKEKQDGGIIYFRQPKPSWDPDPLGPGPFAQQERS